MHTTPLTQNPAATAATPLDDDVPAGLQIFCLPHAGGNSVHFRAWNWLAPYARVVPVDLPGHGSRLGVPLLEDWERLAAELTDHVAERVDGPYVLFGHSLGSLLAFDISHRMLARGLPPSLLVAAGRNGPSEKPAYTPVHELPDVQFLHALDKLGGMPQGLLHQTELLQMFLPETLVDVAVSRQFEQCATFCGLRYELLRLDAQLVASHLFAVLVHGPRDRQHGNDRNRGSLHTRAPIESRRHAPSFPAIRLPDSGHAHVGTR